MGVGGVGGVGGGGGVVGVFFFNDTATTEIYTLSLHDALPICPELTVNLTDLDELDNLIISQSREKLNESCDNGESRDESGEKNDTCDVIATELSSLAENFNLTMTSSPKIGRAHV